MSEKIISILFFLSKCIFSNNLFIFLLFFIGNINTVLNEDANGLNAPYPVCLQLKNKKLLLVNQAGIYFCDENFGVQLSNTYSYDDFSSLLDKVYLVELENDGYSIILIDQIFYFITPGGDYEVTGRLPTDYSFLNLVSYKKDGGDFYFIVSLIDNISVLKIHHYYYKVNQGGFTNSYNIAYTPNYSEYPNIKINYKYFTCQIMYYEDTQKNLLTCCFGTKDSDLIVIQSFDIEDNLKELSEHYAKIENEYLNMITSVTSDDKKNLLVCYSTRDDSTYCFQYNIDTNEITNNKLYVDQCLPKYTAFKTYYFKDSNEFVFICQFNEKFTITKFSQRLDFLYSEAFGFDKYYEFSSISLIYNTNDGGYYEMITDPRNPTSEKMTQKFSLKTLLSQNNPNSINNLNNTNTENNAPWVITKSESVMIISNEKNESMPLIIDFCNKNTSLAKTSDNEAIDISLYYLEIKSNNFEGNLTYTIDGEEKLIDKLTLLRNVCKLKYYKKDTKDGNYDFVFAFTFYDLDNTLKSETANYGISCCKENCTCDEDHKFCKSCLDGYYYYSYNKYCFHKDDLKDKIYSSDEGIFLDCYYKCKTCNSVGNDYNMDCTSCFEEQNFYLNNGGCYEIICDNLFYKDKNTGIKTCIDLTTCPEEYPIFDDNTKECKIIPETEPIQYSESINQIESIESQNSIITIDSQHSILTNNILPSNPVKTTIDQNPQTSKVEKKSNQKEIMELLEDELGESNLDEVDKIYKALSNFIKNGNISSFDEDTIMKGENITYQFTTTENQKKSTQNNEVSVIDLGECEKIIKKNISNETDPTPLLILKIDIKKEETKSTAVEYEVYNPYTKQAIDLSICENETISIYAPVSLNQQEISLYNDLSEQGYDLYDNNNSFYSDICTQYTSQNGTDVQLSDRKNYFYNENIVLCEDNCKYVKVYTNIEKVYCNCSVKNSVNVNGNQEFSPQKLFENFYKVDTFLNFEVLYCYKLVFSSKSLKRNICFYILLVLFVLFLISMIINLFIALKKIEEIIFKIFQDKFMFFFFQRIIMNGRQRRNAKINNDLINNNDNKDKKDEKNGKTKLSWLERLKLASKTRKQNGPTNKDSGKENEGINIVKKKSSKKKVIDDGLIDNADPKDFKKSRKLSLKKKESSVNNNNSNTDVEDDIENDEDKQKEHSNRKKHHRNSQHQKSKSSHHKNKAELEDHDNKKDENIYVGKRMGNININIINNIMNHNKQNPPIKKSKLIIKDQKKDNTEQEEASEIKKKKKIKRRKKIKNKSMNETPKSISSYTPSFANLKKGHKNKLKKSIFTLNEKKEEKREEKKQDSKQPINKKVTYVDEELNTMDYKMALEHDKRNYWQYYWSLLKKKHMIILTFVSNDDYNVFLLKFSLFILSLALYFAINTLFYSEDSLHNIFSEQGRYNLLYQIPKTLYSTLISSIMTFILKRLSLSQNELIDIKKEQNQKKSRKMADKSKKCFKIKLYSFFSFGLVLLLFCWYYISAFAAVYINTQIHLIKDTLISFGISISYPFLINFIPGIFRLQSLKKNDRECLFKTGQIISLF